MVARDKPQSSYGSISMCCWLEVQLTCMSRQGQAEGSSALLRAPVLPTNATQATNPHYGCTEFLVRCAGAQSAKSTRTCTDVHTQTLGSDHDSTCLRSAPNTSDFQRRDDLVELTKHAFGHQDLRCGGYAIQRVSSQQPPGWGQNAGWRSHGSLGHMANLHMSRAAVAGSRGVAVGSTGRQRRREVSDGPREALLLFLQAQNLTGRSRSVIRGV